MKYLLLLLVVALFSACQKQSSTAASLRGRLDAASSIMDVASRDEAFAKLATDAAEAKNAEVSKQAIGSILSVNTKDHAAEAAALALAKQAETSSATEIARMILDTTIRDRTLKAVAKNQ